MSTPRGVDYNPPYDEDDYHDSAPEDFEGFDPDGRYETHIADQADAAYAALSPWGRLVYKWHSRRARRRFLKRYRKARGRTSERPGGFDTEPPF